MAEKKNYWPMAIVLESDGKPVSLHTYESVQSMEEADRVFKTWQACGYTVLATWLQTDTNKIFKHKLYVNTAGWIKPV